MTPFEQVRDIVATVLGLGAAGQQLEPDAPLLGSIPELDSVAVIALIAALEEHFGLSIADDEISAANFATLASLTEFVEQKALA